MMWRIFVKKRLCLKDFSDCVEVLSEMNDEKIQNSVEKDFSKAKAEDVKE